MSPAARHFLEISNVMRCSRLYFVCLKALASVPAPGCKSELLQSGGGVRPAP